MSEQATATTGGQQPQTGTQSVQQTAATNAGQGNGANQAPVFSAEQLVSASAYKPSMQDELEQLRVERATQDRGVQKLLKEKKAFQAYVEKQGLKPVFDERTGEFIAEATDSYKYPINPAELLRKSDLKKYKAMLQDDPEGADEFLTGRVTEEGQRRLVALKPIQREERESAPSYEMPDSKQLDSHIAYLASKKMEFSGEGRYESFDTSIRPVFNQVIAGMPEKFKALIADPSTRALALELVADRIAHSNAIGQAWASKVQAQKQQQASQTQQTAQTASSTSGNVTVQSAPATKGVEGLPAEQNFYARLAENPNFAR